MNKRTRNVVVVALFTILIITAPAVSNAGTNLPYTPAKGSQERKAILDALRDEVLRLHNLRVIFVVSYMKVQNGWAWVQVRPQSPDGKNKYEGILALIHKESNRWKVVEMPSQEEDNLDYVGSNEYFKELKQKFPTVPLAIFPLKKK